MSQAVIQSTFHVALKTKLMKLFFQSYALGLLLTAPIFYKITTVFPAEADVWNPIPQRAKSDH